MAGCHIQTLLVLFSSGTDKEINKIGQSSVYQIIADRKESEVVAA
jgi:hypothetical protein